MDTEAVVALEDAACPVCGHNSPDPAFGYRFDPFRVVRCGDCGVSYLTPRLPETAILEVYRDSNYFGGGGDHGYAHHYGTYVEQEATLRATFRRFARTLARSGLAQGSLLEIGAGFGYFLDEVRPFVAETTGTDLDRDAVARMRASGHAAWLGGVEELPSPARYDTIVAIGVIEHVYHPERFIRELRQRLAQGGRLILATPLMGSVWLRLLGRRWPSFKIPEHVTYYDRRTLPALLTRCGATFTRTLPYLHAFPAGLLAAALGIRLPGWLGRRALWVPATMFASVAGFPSAEDQP